LISQQIPKERFQIVETSTQQPPSSYELDLLESAINNITNEHTIDLVICNRRREVTAARRAAHSIPITVIYTNHLPNEIDENVLNQSDAIIDVCPFLENLEVQNRVYIPPFFEEQCFLEFEPRFNRKDFFLQHFNICISEDELLICMIGNFYENPLFKNHQLLIYAIEQVVQKNNNFHVILVGDGSRRKMCEELVEKIGLSAVIHFLGTSSEIPAMLYYSDFHVLPSIQEAFGIVLLEAGLMKKPSIIAQGTGGAIHLVQHKKTGLLFENNNVDSLAEVIAMMLTDSSLRIVLGNNIYELVVNEYSNKINIGKFELFYQKLLEFQK
jgi:glycosyltransferase involved in cell wall biosynthesis